MTANTHQECPDEGNNTTIRSKTVRDCTHSVFTHTIADVGTGIVTKASTWRLEVHCILDTSQVRASKVGRATNEFREDRGDRGKHDLRELTRSLGSVGGGVDWEGLLPAGGELTTDAAGEFCVLLGVLLAVRGEERVPLLLEFGTTGGSLCVDVVSLLGNDKCLICGEAELGLELSKIISLQSWEGLLESKSEHHRIL